MEKPHREETPGRPIDRAWLAVAGVVLVVLVVSFALGIASWASRFMFAAIAGGIAYLLTTQHTAARESTEESYGSEKARTQTANDALEPLQMEVALLRGVIELQSKALAEELVGIRRTTAELAATIPRLIDALASHAERTSPDAQNRGKDQANPSTASVSPPQLESSPAVTSDEEIQRVLTALTDRCLRTSLVRADFAASLPAGWSFEPFGEGDLPDGFVVDVGSRLGRWLVPNTRAWLPFRESRYFQVEGKDLPSARIVRVTRLPLLSSAMPRSVISPGTAEITP